MKLILNDVEYKHFEIAVPLDGFDTKHAVEALRYKYTVYTPRSQELATVTVFTSNEKQTVLNEWCFEKDNLEITDNMTIIKNATLIEAAPRIG